MSVRAGDPTWRGGFTQGARQARSHRARVAAERADRAARVAGLGEPAHARVNRRFAVWLVGRLLALALLVGAAWVVYDSASSQRFITRQVRVSGNVLLSKSEVESAAAVTGANVFWIDRRQVEARLRALPVVQSAEVSPVLPGSVDVRVVERQPVGFWIDGGRAYVVDREGVVLKAVGGQAGEPRACAGRPCDPLRASGFPVVAQDGGDPVVPGMRVRVAALSAASRLSSLLPPTGVKPTSYAWSPSSGLEVATDQGFALRFDEAGDLPTQVGAVQAIRDLLARSRQSATLIDVRFSDRPYYR